MSSDGWEAGWPPVDETPAAPKFLIESPEPGLPSRVTLLGDDLLVRRKHWDQSLKRPIPCRGCEELCDYCKAGRPLFRTGYLPAILTTGGRRVIFQLSDSALLALRRIKVTLPTLRGHCFFSERADSRRNSKQTIEYRGEDPREFLAEAFDVRPTLIVMWGLAEVRLAAFERLGVKPGRRQPRPRGDR